jgi:hypothetical protein
MAHKSLNLSRIAFHLGADSDTFLGHLVFPLTYKMSSVCCVMD